jgi:hypothetical protein
MANSVRRGPAGGVGFHHPVAFWTGVLLVIAGVIGHIPMYLMGRHTGYVLAGMPMDGPMQLGMSAIVAGLAASLYGLYPRGGRSSLTGPRVEVRAMDDAAITRTHVGLLVVMAIAVTIDIMKPTTLAFVVPGMTTEYGLKSPLNPTGTVSAGYLPLAGIVGTVLGSFIWGWLGDVIGRRGSILYAGITFIVAGDWVVESRALLYVLLVMPIWGINSVVAVLAVYSAEIYPTLVRSRGTGLAAGASKFGGVLMISLVALGVAAPSIATVALIGAVPLALAAVAVAVWGVETRHRTLEEISGAQADPGLPPPAAVR